MVKADVVASLLFGVCAASSVSSPFRLDEGLLGHWPFTEGEGLPSAGSRINRKEA